MKKSTEKRRSLRKHNNRSLRRSKNGKRRSRVDARKIGKGKTYRKIEGGGAWFDVQKYLIELTNEQDTGEKLHVKTKLWYEPSEYTDNNGVKIKPKPIQLYLFENDGLIAESMHDIGDNAVTPAKYRMYFRVARSNGMLSADYDYRIDFFDIGKNNYGERNTDDTYNIYDYNRNELDAKKLYIRNFVLN
jgi:hypothetical protein